MTLVVSHTGIIHRLAKILSSLKPSMNKDISLMTDPAYSHNLGGTTSKKLDKDFSEKV